ncbi:TPA: hypothetical protein JG869_003356 [Enterobacter hormaechei subsp. steigerwaltii]|uniref:hypothetical protein n=1 Tax=Enterobacter hormaechei TaxID=158836 RepID=UPI000B8C8F74|nr:hypothetical protein [Enterobacter hormaechei]OXU37696.1 hypothetical protein BME81_05590 [Enterobacter hormaechei subsp. steigerwaltii]HAV1611701.1 hypothetical protein [Enterobacter hormaechei subsp. steigerwaltii]HAV1625225.1 hypothetical protein [Enterobacter hormaechei subsp. steigerwaltii]
MLADRWGEKDPRKIAALPANILTYWQAYFDLLKTEAETPEPVNSLPVTAAQSESEQQFADCFRILGNGC